jgi:hypothetical protein
MDVMEATRKRRSIRAYKPTPVDQGILDMILEAGSRNKHEVIRISKHDFSQYVALTQVVILREAVGSCRIDWSQHGGRNEDREAGRVCLRH